MKILLLIFISIMCAAEENYKIIFTIEDNGVVHEKVYLANKNTLSFGDDTDEKVYHKDSPDKSVDNPGLKASGKIHFIDDGENINVIVNYSYKKVQFIEYTNGKTGNKKSAKFYPNVDSVSSGSTFVTKIGEENILGGSNVIEKGNNDGTETGKDTYFSIKLKIIKFLSTEMNKEK